MDNLTPNTTPTPENNSNSRKKVLIGTLALVLLLSGTYYFGSGTGTQGSINRSKVPVKTETRALEQRETPPATTGVLRGKPAKNNTSDTTTTAPTSTPVQTTPPPEQTPPTVATETFDASTMDISRQWQGESKYSSVIFYNDTTNGVQFNYKLPTYSGPNYTKNVNLQLCKNTNCKDIKNLNGGGGTVVLNKDEVTAAVTLAGISNGDQGTIQYTINNPEGTINTSKSLAFTFYDYNAKPMTASGQSLFDQSTMSVEKFSVTGGGGYKSSGSQIFYDNIQKSALTFKFNLPTYSIGAAANAKTGYLQPLSLKVCNSDSSLCQTLKEDTRWIFHKDEKFETTAATYRQYIDGQTNDELVNLIKNNIAQYDKFFFFFTIQDPTGITLQTNKLELVINENDKAVYNPQPIEGSIFDETTFNIPNIEYNSSWVKTGELKYDMTMPKGVIFKYKLPDVKVGATQSIYQAYTVLEFCDAGFTTCMEVPGTNSEPNVKYPNKVDVRQNIVTQNDFYNLITANPDKDTFRYKITDPNGQSFYTTNIIKLIRQ